MRYILVIYSSINSLKKKSFTNQHTWFFTTALNDILLNRKRFLIGTNLNYKKIFQYFNDKNNIYLFTLQFYYLKTFHFEVTKKIKKARLFIIFKCY